MYSACETVSYEIALTIKCWNLILATNEFKNKNTIMAQEG